MNAAKELSNQGYEAFIVEREPELGGLMKKIHYELIGKEKDVQKKLNELIELTIQGMRTVAAEIGLEGDTV